MTDTFVYSDERLASGKLSALERCGHSLGDMAGNFVYISVTVFLGFFYTEVYGLDAATVASIFLVVRTFDAINDPIIGSFVEKTNTRWGKCRPWILVVCIPYAIASVAVFSVPELDESSKVLYAYITYAVLMLLFTMINIPHGTLTAKLTPDPVEREKLNSVRFMFGTAGGLVISSCVLPLAEWYSDDLDIGYQFSMMIMASISIVMFFITFFSTEERVIEDEVSKESFSISLKYLLQNRPFVMLSIITVVMVTGQIVKGTTQMFYMSAYVVNGYSYMGWFLSAWMVGGMIGANLASTLLTVMCKKRAYIYLNFLSAALSLFAMYIGNDNIYLIVGLSFFVGLINQMIAPIWFTYVSDTQDYSELKYGKRFDGLAVSLVMFSLKIGLSIGGALAMWALSLYGYQSGGVDQAIETKEGILFVFSVVPAILFVFTAFLISFLNLNSKTIRNNSHLLQKQRMNLDNNHV